ncbi:outer membrane protein [Methylobacterium sp. J-070]|uniref:outer membrane protein n=1 Tax=Methylobacterium sp. J-070 TaxID=2836650 RepID=UPI001FB8D8C8|nr:porin family protein [Methylobacterium sp. J-070]MCJ2051128.1 porin family protein [Methylobacterium sp. J-070]
MKKLLTSLAAFTALTAAATAADLPRRAPPPVFTPVPVFTWTGAYFGINAGYGFDASSNQANGFVQTPGNPVAISPAGAFVPAILATGSSLTYGRNNNEGFTGGGQIGYNYQFTPGSGVVVGFEADAQYVDFGNRRQSYLVNGAVGPAFGSFVPTNGLLSTLDFFGTVRGRLGYAFDRVLFYGTGGFAYATGDQGARVAFQNFAGSRSSFVTGWTVGGGIEYALPTDSFLNFFRSSAVTLKVEGLYVNLDQGRNSGLPLVGGLVTGAGLVPVFNNVPVRNSNDFAVIRAGLNYKFGSY